MQGSKTKKIIDITATNVEFCA